MELCTIPGGHGSKPGTGPHFVRLRPRTVVSRLRALVSLGLCVSSLSLSLSLSLGALPSRVFGAEDLGQGFAQHGVAAPVSTHRGLVATVDRDGRNVILLWLYDHRGGYGLLMIDAETGQSQTFTTPFPWGGDGPYASILSRANKFYTHFGSHFCEFDPAQRAFTFHRRAAPQMAMSITEDDRGVIWSTTYPNSGLVSFDPHTREFRDYGSLNKENWTQYPRSIAADDAGWIYVSLGSTARQVMIFDPQTARATPLLPASERSHGALGLYRDQAGKVQVPLESRPKYVGFELYRGQARPLTTPPKSPAQAIIAGSQGLSHDRFPDGKRLKSCDLLERRLVVEDPKAKTIREVRFDYQSEGAGVMGLAAAPDGTICGGTAFPMQFFSYHPRTAAWTRHTCYGQWNTTARQGDRFFVGGYGHGFLLEWDPSRPWMPTVKDKADCNPRFLTECPPTINRPHALLAHPDGKTLVLAGTPGYGYTGGGLLFWDRSTSQRVLLEHTDVIGDHSTHSLVALPGARLLGGTTTGAGTGGEKKARVAELYLLDLTTKKIVWHEAVLPKVQTYEAMVLGPNGKVYGFADRSLFFVFDPQLRQVVYQENVLASLGRATSQQGPRVFVTDPQGMIYTLFERAIARLDPAGNRFHVLARSPVPIGAGGDWLDGRIYFAYQSRIYSYQVPIQGGP